MKPNAANPNPNKLEYSTCTGSPYTIAAVAAEYISSSSQVYGGSGFVESVLFKSELFLGLVLGISRNYGSLFSPNNA